MKRSVSELALMFEPHILVFRDMTFVKKHKSLIVKKRDKMWKMKCEITPKIFT